MAGIYQMIHRETVTLVNMKISAVAAGAFIDFGDSETAKLINHLGYLIKIRSNSNGACLQGFGGSAGTAETLDVEQFVSPTVDAGWTDVGGGVYSAAAPAAYPLVHKDVVVALKLYKAVFTIDSVVSGKVQAVIGNSTGSQRGTVATFTQYLTSTTSSTALGIQSVAFSGAVSSLSFKQVLTPSASGVTIVSTKGGTTQSFAQKDANFNYASATYTVEYWKVNSAVEVATGSITAGEGKMDLTTANAFAAPESATVPINLSAYQDGRHIYWAKDSAGAVAVGWISATAPGGETLATTGGPLNNGELLTDYSFDNSASWTTKETGWSVAGGNATAVTVPINNAVGQSGSVVGTGSLIKTVAECSSITAGAYILRVGNAFSPVYSNSGTKTFYSTGDSGAYNFIKSSTLLSGVFASLSSKKLTDCAATGALILSTQGGSRGWIKDAAFNPNLALTYRIYFVGAP